MGEELAVQSSEESKCGHRAKGVGECRQKAGTERAGFVAAHSQSYVPNRMTVVYLAFWYVVVGSAIPAATYAARRIVLARKRGFRMCEEPRKMSS